MSVMRTAPVSTRHFTWLGSPRMFVAEASTLEANGIYPAQVFDDAIDEGYTLVSERTGREVTVGANHTERDREGDLLFTDYVPVDARGPQRHPAFTVRVFND